MSNLSKKKRRALVGSNAAGKELTRPQLERLENLCRYGFPVGAAEEEARRKYLDAAIENLERPGVGVDVALAALGEAHAERVNSLIRARGLDHLRELHAEIVLLRKALRRAHRHLLPLLGPDPGPYEGLDPSRHGQPSQVGRVRDALQALEDSPVLDPESPAFAGRLRRAKRGHQPEPWLAGVEERLKAAGVPEEDQDPLLRLTGLR